MPGRGWPSRRMYPMSARKYFISALLMQRHYYETLVHRELVRHCSESDIEMEAQTDIALTAMRRLASTDHHLSGSSVRTAP